MGWGDSRDQRRWQRELEAQLAALPTYEGETPDGGPVAPVERRLPSPPRLPPREQRSAHVRAASERRRTLVTVAVTLSVVVALLAVTAGPWAATVRGLIGWDGGRGETSSYRFLAVQEGTVDVPVTWSSCKPITYVVNDAGAPAGWRETLHEAVDAVSEATGLAFVDAGTTTARDFEGRVDGDELLPVLIGWATPSEVPTLADAVVGVAGPVTVYYAEGGNNTGQYESGSVVFDVEAFARMERAGEERLQRAVMQHELGHLVGLDHVDDEKQLMFPNTTFQATFGNGDLEGLARLGTGACY